MIEASIFSIVNVSIGFIVSWILGHYFLPWFFGAHRSFKRSFAITVVFTVAALIRNVLVYWGFTNV